MAPGFKKVQKGEPLEEATEPRNAKRTDLFPLVCLLKPFPSYFSALRLSFAFALSLKVLSKRPKSGRFVSYF